MMILTGLVVSGVVAADDVSDADRLLCSPSDVSLCFENGKCFEALPWQLEIPSFIVVDVKKKVMSSTEASGENRSTPISATHRDDGKLIIQGHENGRAFSVIIQEAIGAFSAAIARDGFAVAAFGSCTDSDKI